MTPDRLSRLLQSRAPAQDRATLTGLRATSYAAMVASLVRSGRLNHSFPEQRGLIRFFELLDPAANHFVYDGFEIGLSTGLPTERIVTRVLTDAALARQACSEAEALDPRLDANGSHSSASDERWLRSYRYHRGLIGSSLPSSFQLRLDLRTVDTDRRTARFTAILDRFDLATELFVRYTVHLRHRAPRWARAQVRLEGDDLHYTQSFENLVARRTALDSELAFVLLSEPESVTVEGVSRSQVGPLFFDGTRAPPPLVELLSERPGEFILSLPADRTALDIHTDTNGDPFAVPDRERLTANVRDDVQSVRKQLGYGTRRESKFVCTPGIAAALRGLLSEMQKPCVIYTTRATR